MEQFLCLGGNAGHLLAWSRFARDTTGKGPRASLNCLRKFRSNRRHPEVFAAASSPLCHMSVGFRVGAGPGGSPPTMRPTTPRRAVYAPTAAVPGGVGWPGGVRIAAALGLPRLNDVKMVFFMPRERSALS
jgi:hypothetical protein